MPHQIAQLLNPADVNTLLTYISTDDIRTDSRPDVRSKHPRWDQDDWPQHIIQSALDQIFPDGYYVEEVTFQDTTISLKPHTDNSSQPNTVGKTLMFTLFAQPEAHTVFFKNYWRGQAPSGVFFTRSYWSPYQYKLLDKNGKLISVDDLRTLLQQCLDAPESVTDFNVTPSFIKSLVETIHKRSLPLLSDKEKDFKSGYIQPAPRRNDYESLSAYDPNLKFDREFHQRYLSDIPIEDLHGLDVDCILTWEAGDAILFDREQLHCSSSCHQRKIFCTVFCHELS